MSFRGRFKADSQDCGSGDEWEGLLCGVGSEATTFSIQLIIYLLDNDVNPAI